jgi:hypothetical protein
MFDSARQAEPSALNPAFLARQVAAFSDDDMSTFVKTFEASKRERDLDRAGLDRSSKCAPPPKEVEAPGAQKWLVLLGERTSELFQEIYTLENELRPLLRVTTTGGDGASTSAPDPFLVVDHLAMHHNALSMASALVRNVRQRLQL